MSYLTTADRQRIVDKLCSGTVWNTEKEEDRVAQREIAECAWHDMALIEPVIEEIIARHREQVRNGQYFVEGQP